MRKQYFKKLGYKGTDFLLKGTPDFFTNWEDLPTTYIIQHKNPDEVVTEHAYLYHGGEEGKFYEGLKNMCHVLSALVGSVDDNDIYLLRNIDDGVSSKDELGHLWMLFNYNRIPYDYANALQVLDQEALDYVFTKMLTSGEFYLYIPAKKVVLVPTEYMDIFVISEDIQSWQAPIKTILKDLGLDEHIGLFQA